jgi:hypothetical protein
MGDRPVDTIKVPASLDLVERARLGINGLAGSVNPHLDYEPYFLTLQRDRYTAHTLYECKAVPGCCQGILYI